jgi:endonuclease YncB( thermonuclease family)
VRDTDRYGRLVAEVILPNGRSLGHELVEAGMAWWYKRYPPRRYGTGATRSQGEGGEAWVMERSARRGTVPVAAARSDG